MHELSIAQNIIEIIHQNVALERIRDVRSVSVNVGAFSGIVPDSLEFSYQVMCSGTPLQRSFLTLNRIPFVVHCRNCQMQSENNDGIVLCPNCSSSNTKILSGNELHVKEIELEDIVPEYI